MKLIEGTSRGAADVAFEWTLHLPEGHGPVPVVLVAHGFKGFRRWGFFPWLCEELARAGIAAIGFDMSHNGVGRGDEAEDFTRLDLFEQNRVSYELQDIDALVSDLGNGVLPRAERLDAERVGLLGHSRGGAAVLLRARAERVRAVVTWASVATTAYSADAMAAFRDVGSWDVLNGRTGQLMRVGPGAFEDIDPMPPEHDLDRAVASLEVPTLFVHGAADPSVPASASRHLFDLAGERGRLALIEGADHVMNARHPFAGKTPELDEATRLSIDFFVDHLTR